MSNQDQVAQVIRTWQKRHKNVMDSNPDWAAQNLAGDLHQAGLLAIDLPEPDRAVASDEAEWYLPGQISIIYRSADRIGVFGLTPNRQRFHLSLTDVEAEDAAHKLLAAANYSEEA